MDRLVGTLVVALMLAGAVYSFPNKATGKLDKEGQSELWKRLLTALQKAEVVAKKQSTTDGSNSGGQSTNGGGHSGNAGSESYHEHHSGAGSMAGPAYHDHAFVQAVRDEAVKSIMHIVKKVMEEVIREMYEEPNKDEKCQHIDELGPELRAAPEDDEEAIFGKMESTYQGLTYMINDCSGETVFTQQEIDGMIALAQEAYDLDQPTIAVADLEMAYEEGKGRAMEYAYNWDEYCQAAIETLDCNMGLLHEEMKGPHKK